MVALDLSAFSLREVNQQGLGWDQLGMEAVGTAARIVTNAAAGEQVQRALAGEEAAFEWIVETYSADMAHVCFVVCGDSALAEEAVAAAWPLAWRNSTHCAKPIASARG